MPEFIQPEIKTVGLGEKIEFNHSLEHSEFEEKFIKMYEQDPDSAWLGLITTIMSTSFPEEILEHHGIDGQKWGVRNGPPYPLERKKTHLLNKSKAKILIDNLDELSLEDVERLVKRIKLEEELNKIAADDIKKGESYAMKILKKTGETVLSVAVPALTTYAFKKIVENVGGEDMVGEMFPKKK